MVISGHDAQRDTIDATTTLNALANLFTLFLIVKKSYMYMRWPAAISVKTALSFVGIMYFSVQFPNFTQLRYHLLLVLC